MSWTGGTLFAQNAELWQELQERTRPTVNLGSLPWAIGALCAIGIMVWIVAQIVARRDFDTDCNHPKTLFFRLCKVHGLNRGQIGLLKQLSRQHALEPAARIFLEPELFTPERIPASLQSKAEQLVSLGKKLFASSTSSDPETVESLSFEA